MKKTIRALLITLAAIALVLTSTAAPLEGMFADVFAAEPTAYTVLDNCDTNTYFSSYALDEFEFMQGIGSIRTSVNGTTTVQNTKSIAYEVDASVLSDQYLELWLYLDNANSVVQTESYIGIYQSTSIKAETKLSKLDSKLRNGWNKIQIRINGMEFKNRNQFTTINRVYFTIKTTRNMTMRVDDICLIAATQADDLSALEAAIAAGDALAATDLSGFATENVEAFEAALELAKSRLTKSSQRDVDVATAVLKNAMNAFGMEGMEDDPDALVAYIDFNTKTYSRIDRYAVRNADGSEGDVTTEPVGGKNAAAFSGTLSIAVNDEYVSSKDAKVRVTYTYYDGAAGALKMAYNSTADAAQDGGSVTFGNTGFWTRCSTKVLDAQFSEAIAGGYDLQIALAEGELAYVTRVEIKLVTDDDVTEAEPPTFAPMTDINNFEDKSVAGYQMWFTASPGNSGWIHWAGGNIPSNDRISFEMWPDTSEYPDSVLENTAFNNLGDGRPAKLFTSVKQETVDLHVSWMQDAGLDGFAIQRFYGAYNSGTDSDNLNLRLAAEAAEKYERVFYVMYDLNGALGAGNRAAEVLKSDFVRNVEQTGVIQSTSYAQMDGKPVVCMWGIDPSSDSYANHDATMEFICWLQDRGYYVVGGTSNNGWYEENSFTDVYRQLDMISPWTVGRYSHNGVAEWMKNSYTPTIAECEKYGIEFQPVIIAGGSWHNHNWGMPNDQPHYAGNFLWRQVYLLKNIYKAERVYFAMFDEYDEGTAIMKAAQDSYDIPEDEQYFLTLATDGTWLSSDFNLRLAGYICDVMRTEGDVDTTQPVVHSQGPIYWRNSFEQRWTYVREENKEAGGRTTVGVSLQSLDVGMPMLRPYDMGEGVALDVKQYECKTYVEYVEGNTDYKKYGTNTTGSGLHHDATKAHTSNGTWSLQVNGESFGGSDAWFAYRIADTAITVSAAGLELTYDRYAENDIGRSVFLDLILTVDGQTKRLSDYVSDVKKDGTKTGAWETVTIKVPESLVGQKIIGVLMCFEGRDEGFFNAYLDDVVLQSPGSEKTMLQTAVDTASALESDSEELAAAIAAAQPLLEGNTVSAKERLKAMKAIDTVIREQGITATGGMMGDADSNGKVNTTDARKVLQYAAESIGESELNLSVSDVNGDGKVNTTDARRILQYAAGLIESFE